MAREVNVIVEADEDGIFVVSVPALRGCHTRARSLDKLMSRIREAVESCLAKVGEPTKPKARAK
jgi:predicted RNase H-like HicB family nuclease